MFDIPLHVMLTADSIDGYAGKNSEKAGAFRGSESDIEIAPPQALRCCGPIRPWARRAPWTI